MSTELYDKERIERLREKAIHPTISIQEYCLYFYRRYIENDALLHPELRYADALKYAFSHATPSIGEDELLVGKADARLSPEEQEEYDKLMRTTARAVIANCGQDSHRAIDYGLLLSAGAHGVKARIEQKRAALDLTREEDMRKDIFYQSALLSLEAAVILSNRYADKAEELAAACGDSTRAEELRAIARICRRVPEYPAESFYEAVQSVHFMTFCLTADPFRPFSSMQYQLGRPDQYLYPFYLRDKQAGRLTDAQTQTLLDCLGILINHRVPSGLSSGYMVGGSDRQGRLVANELTEMGMRVVEHIRLVYPAVGLCWRPDMPETYLQTACNILGKGFSHPAVFNDPLITDGLKSYGLSDEEARLYIHSTCVEITPIASSNVWVASPYTNLVQILLDCLDREYADMEELISAVLSRLSASIRNNLINELSSRVARLNRAVNPLISCFTDDCIERGLDSERGGARYNWIMPSFVGMANLVDSLYVIQKVIFEEKAYTFAELKHMLDCNFEGYEPQRLEFLNRIDKYGNDCDDVDQYTARLTAWIVAECRKYRFNDEGGQLIPSVFCWIMHDIFGRETGASPDGRKAHFPLGDGSGPAQGREHKGPTASILSSTKWNQKPFIGGVAVNMKFSKKLFSEESSAKMTALIKTYLERGGFEIQINVTDRETLLKARETPELYQDLVVRIGGYSDYFVRLSPTMQEEVLMRTEHEL